MEGEKWKALVQALQGLLDDVSPGMGSQIQSRLENDPKVIQDLRDEVSELTEENDLLRQEVKDLKRKKK